MKKKVFLVIFISIISINFNLPTYWIEELNIKKTTRYEKYNSIKREENNNNDNKENNKIIKKDIKKTISYKKILKKEIRDRKRYHKSLLSIYNNNFNEKYLNLIRKNWIVINNLENYYNITYKWEENII